MNTAHRLEFFTNADGEPWACFAWGDVPLAAITAPRIQEAAQYYAVGDLSDEDLAGVAVAQFWIRQSSETDHFQDPMWDVCGAHDDGATLVTGVRFQ